MEEEKVCLRWVVKRQLLQFKVFIIFRDPFNDEVKEGNSKIRIASFSGVKWIIKEGIDEYISFSLSERYFGKVVPFTFILEGKVPHTAQLFIEGKVANDFGYELFEISKKSISNLAGMICLDLVIRNSDRHSNNWLISNSGNIYAIDNSIGEHKISMKEALRPAFRCLLINDKKYSKILANNILNYLRLFNYKNKEFSYVEEAIEDVLQWKKDVTDLHKKGFIVK